jgi:hypothetical protein
MLMFLATSHQTDLSEGNLRLVLIWCGIMIAAAGLALVPLVIARVRRHRHVETLLACTIVWGLLAAFSVGHAVGAQISWAKEYQLRVETGYYDPRDLGDAPLLPWLGWGLLALAYLVLLMWASAGRSTRDQNKLNMR